MVVMAGVWNAVVWEMWIVMYAMVVEDVEIVKAVANQGVTNVVEVDAVGFAEEVEKYCVQNATEKGAFGMGTKEYHAQNVVAQAMLPAQSVPVLA